MTEQALSDFLNYGKVSDVITLLNETKKNKLYKVSTELSNFFQTIFPKNFEILYALAESFFHTGQYRKCYDTLYKIISTLTLPENTLLDIGKFQANCIPYIEDDYTYYNEKIVQKLSLKKQTQFPLITLTMTSCKRYDLFEKTVNSFLNCCLDLDVIDKWICIDDNSTEEDRVKMKQKYPFFQFYFKSISEKGHPQSMNIIKKSVKTPYIFHLEDDWKFFFPRTYITDLMDVLSKSDNIGQCLINKNYTETSKDSRVIGGLLKRSESGLYYYEHEYCRTQQDWEKFYLKHGRGSNSAYWGHFSLRPSLLKRSVLDKLGEFDEKVSHFEAEYSKRYVSAGYVSTFLDGIYSIHIGRLTSEISDMTKINAYSLNNEKQFSGKEEDIAKTYVINLDRRKDRMDKFKKEAEKVSLKYERFSGVDGSLLIPNKRLQRIFENNDYNMREGMVGCAMSHIKLWIELAQSSFSYFCIFEDDAEFVHDFNAKLETIKKNLPSQWSLVYLGYHLRDKYKTEDYYDKKASPILEKWGAVKSLTYSLGGTSGYIISKKGAIELLNFINKTGMTNGIDTVQQKAADIINIYYSKPYLVYSECYKGDNSVDTDIQYNFKSLDLGQSVSPTEMPERLLKNGVFYIEDGLQYRKNRYFIALSETTHASEAINKVIQQTDSFPFDKTDGGDMEIFSEIVEKALECTEGELKVFCEKFLEKKWNITFPHDNGDKLHILSSYVEKFQNLRNLVNSQADVVFFHVSRWKKTRPEVFRNFSQFLKKYNKNVKIVSVNGLEKEMEDKVVERLSLDFPEKYHNDAWYYDKIIYDQNVFRVDLVSLFQKYVNT